MTKISDLTALLGAAVDAATDLIPIVDMSEAGAARNKKITLAELKTALGVPAAYTDEQVRDVIAAALVSGTNITITNDDASDTITIDAGAGGGLDAEAVMDLIADMLTAGSNVTLTYDDASDTLTVASSGAGSGTLAGLSDVDLTGAATGDVLTKDAGGDWVPEAPSTGTSFTGADNTVGAYSNTAYPTRGALVVPMTALKIKGAWFKINETSGSAYIVTIYQVDGSNVITAIVASSASRTSPATATTRPFFTFASPVTLAAGSRYVVALRRTDGTDTTSADSYAGTGDPKGMPIEDTTTYCRLAKKTPVVGDAFGSGSNPYYYGVTYNA